MQTESQNPSTHDLDRMDTLAMVQTINAEDAKVTAAVNQALPAIAQAIDAIANLPGRLIYIGAGTSGRLGVLDAVECVPTFGVPPGEVIGIVAGGDAALTQSIEGAEDQPEGGRADLQAANLTTDDAVVGIAASGRTPYVIGALEYANSTGALTVAVACNLPAPILEIARIAIGVPVGPEVLTGSTRLKSGTAQKMVLNMLSTGVMVKRGKTYGNLMVDVQVSNQKLADRARRIIAQVADVDIERAGQLLEQAGDNVKVAIVISRRNVDAASARRLLEETGGHLRRVIG